MKRFIFLSLSILALLFSSCNKVCQVACFDEPDQEYTTKVINVKCSSVKNFVNRHTYAKYDVYEVIKGVRVLKEEWYFNDENAE